MSAIKKTYLNKIKNNILNYAMVRRDVIKESGDALHYAKRAIFAMHRDNMKEAVEKIKESEKIIKALNKKHRNSKAILDEGAYKAALEEYVEAVLFYQFITTNKIDEIKSINIPGEIYIAGLCDVPGELYRYAIKSATERNVDMVKKCSKMAAEITGELIEFNLTSYLRNKFDQAKSAVQKIERVVYELSLRQ
ncbi:MAG: hypothetical protein COX81_03865 [Candidatus Magasanikbacteria bacterium CG_4_10_14_0_2_um_filter_37_12]|uniref:Haloacid dehalogenase n=1 Tax=Candidatus Magasanikbacteria bacterium CG_4_10_14_0_2_um_filter_37_12 TaxID=1974637 RepID=A0A2M7V6P6_9BACT|nr:MAG: hypothetical protein COX81_03865 [Candidatus Magasanikbacteria bacterium CG_4_10_14_0_2_um_filter_37_12]